MTAIEAHKAHLSSHKESSPFLIFKVPLVKLTLKKIQNISYKKSDTRWLQRDCKAHPHNFFQNMGAHELWITTFYFDLSIMHQRTPLLEEQDQEHTIFLKSE